MIHRSQVLDRLADANHPAIRSRLHPTREAKPPPTVSTGWMAKKVEVAVGLTDEENLEVLSGLSPGARVVTKGINLVRDGGPVRIVE